MQIDRKIDTVQADEVVDATGKYVFLGMERAGRATYTVDEGMITRLPLGQPP